MSSARVAVSLAVALLAALSVPASGSGAGVVARNGDKLGAELGPDDVDRFAVDLSEGGQLTLKLKAAKGTDLLPELRLFRPDGSEIDVLPFLKKGGTAKPQLKKVRPTTGETGTWRIEVSPSPGTSGGYGTIFQIAAPASFKAKKRAVAVDEIVRVEFTADEGALLTLTVKEKGDGTLAGVRVLAPDGSEVPGTAALLSRKKRVLKMKKAPLTGGFGRYAIELTGAADLDTLADVIGKVKFAKRTKRKETLPAEAQLATVEPAVIRQEDRSVVVMVSGTNLLGPATATVSGEGVTVTDVDVLDSTRANITLDVAADAPFGLRDLTFCPPPLLAEPVALPLSLQVNAPDPTVAALSLASVTQGESGTALEITGARLRDGGEIVIGGVGVTVGATTVVSDTIARTTLSTAIDADAAPRTVTFRQPAGGGAAEGTAATQLSVFFPQPGLASVNPGRFRQNSTGGTITLTGSNFRAGGQVRSGTGITITNPTFVSDTEFRATIAVSSGASLGTRDVRYTQSSAAGAATVELTDAFVVDAPVPSIASVSPTALDQGDGATTVTVDGSGFFSGGTLSFSGDGLTVGPTTFISSSQVSTTVAVSGTATVGARSVSYMQDPAKGGALGSIVGGLEIHAGTPTIASVAPTQIEQGDTGTLTLTGTEFTPGGTVSASGSGVTFSQPTFVSTTSFTVQYSVDIGATISFRDITFSQEAAAGGGMGTLSNAVEIQDAGVQLTTITPSLLLGGTSRETLVLTGAEFNVGTTVSFSGSGITLHSTTRNSNTQLTLVVSLDLGATLGARDITITPGAGGLPARVFDDRFTVAPRDPFVRSFSAASLARNASGVSVTIRGSNFRSGATVAASGAGVTFSNVTVTSNSELTADVTVTGSATTGSRDVSVSHSSTLGGRSGTLTDATEIVSGTPTVTSLTPSAIGRTGSGGATRDVPVVITGTNFMSGATLSLAKSGGSGLSVVANSADVLSATKMAATLSVTGTATTGLWDATVTNPATLGNSGTTGNSAVDVKSESTLAVNRVIDASGATYGGERVTIHGSGFTAGAVVDFGTERAVGTQVIDGGTIVTTVPPPASPSPSTTTTVDVKVTLTGGSNATLTSGYAYARDVTGMTVVKTIPAQGATGVSNSLKSVCVLLSAPCDTSTAAHGSTSSTNSFFFESGSFIQSSSRGHGPATRWFVVSRTSTSALNAALHVVNIPTTLKSISGTDFVPTRLAASGARDQYTFTIGSSGDSTAPTLSTIVPANAATSVSPVTRVSLTFNEELDPRTITSTNVTFKQGSTTIAAALAVDDDLKTITITPETELATSTVYTTTVTSSVTDLSGNAFSQTSYTFTTNNGTDTTAPTIDSVVLEALPADLDGSGTYVNTSGSAGNAFDAYVARAGWGVVVTFSDEGGGGIDDTTFSAKASVAVGSNGANAELGGNFTVTSTRAEWRVPTGTAFTAGDNVTFTFSIQDGASTPNTATAHVITIDVVDKDGNVSGASGGDHDPLDTRQSWVLRGDLDAYTATFTTQASPAAAGATTTTSSNNIPDLDEALRLIGFNSTSMTTAAAATSNGVDTGTNAIVRTLFLERTRESLRERYSIDEDGARDDDAMEIEFLLPGEQGALSTFPTASTSNSSNSAKAFSEMSLGGTLGADNSSFASFSTLGQAWFDQRNRRQEANLNLPSSSITGVYLLGMFENRVNGSSGSSFRANISDVFVPIYGGTPVGEHASDDDVLAGTFDRTTSSNTTHNARYDEIMDALELISAFASATLSHEICHSTGGVADGAPKTGLFGNAHHSNTFTEATSTSTNTSHHINSPGPDLMAPASSFEEDTGSGVDFARFNPLMAAWLRGRLVHDEGK